MGKLAEKYKDWKVQTKVWERQFEMEEKLKKGEISEPYEVEPASPEDVKQVEEEIKKEKEELKQAFTFDYIVQRSILNFYVRMIVVGGIIWIIGYREVGIPIGGVGLLLLIYNGIRHPQK